MKKLFQISIFIFAVSAIFSCKQEEGPSLDNPNVISTQIDSTLKNYYPKPSPASTFENIFTTSFPNDAESFSMNMNWYDPVETNGIYLHFNNTVGDFLLDEKGFVKSFDSGVKIDSTLAGTWSGNQNGIISYDYVLYPAADKGNLAGQGDKYIIFRAFSYDLPTLKYYGNLRLSVSANGREVKIVSIAYQKNPNSSFVTGEF